MFVAQERVLQCRREKWAPGSKEQGAGLATGKSEERK